MVNVTDLSVFPHCQVVNKMGGIEAYEEMTPDQVEAMSGGELLRQEAGNFSQVGEVSRVCVFVCLLLVYSIRAT